MSVRTALALPLVLAVACARGNGTADAPADDAGILSFGHGCDGATTTISGRVFDPAGKNPLYEVVVYIPASTPDALPGGATCGSCDALYTGRPMATAMTDASGHFTLANAPAGTNIPLVVQIGKWRRQLVVDHVDACKDNPQPDGALRLPRNQNEGDMPNIAVSTGNQDSLECLLGRIGLDSSEYVGGAGPGHIHIFQGGAGAEALRAPNTSPPGPPSASALWKTKEDLLAYDLVLLSCEGDETAGMNQQALYDYAAAGGRVFASHYHYAWFNTGPFASANLAAWITGPGSLGGVTSPQNIQADVVMTTPIDDGTFFAPPSPFPEGIAMHDWLANVHALASDKLTLYQPRHNADVTGKNVHSQPWIIADASSGASGTMYFSFDTPLDAEPAKQCGRVVYSDLHVSGDPSINDYASGTVVTPRDCASGDLSAQEKVLEFMLFDLSACVTPIGITPAPPPPVR